MRRIRTDLIRAYLPVDGRHSNAVLCNQDTFARRLKYTAEICPSSFDEFKETGDQLWTGDPCIYLTSEMYHGRERSTTVACSQVKLTVSHINFTVYHFNVILLNSVLKGIVRAVPQGRSVFFHVSCKSLVEGADPWSLRPTTRTEGTDSRDPGTSSLTELNMI